MKTLITLGLILCIGMLEPLSLKADQPITNEKLQKEIADLVKNHTLHNMDTDTQDVTVHFVINAQNELVIFDASGDNLSACKHVKDILNFRQIRYKQAKQLTPYIMNIRFVKKT